MSAYLDALQQMASGRSTIRSKNERIYGSSSMRADTPPIEFDEVGASTVATMPPARPQFSLPERSDAAASSPVEVERKARDSAAPNFAPIDGREGQSAATNRALHGSREPLESRDSGGASRVVTAASAAEGATELDVQIPVAEAMGPRSTMSPVPAPAAIGGASVPDGWPPPRVAVASQQTPRTPAPDERSAPSAKVVLAASIEVSPAPSTGMPPREGEREGRAGVDIASDRMSAFATFPTAAKILSRIPVRGPDSAATGIATPVVGDMIVGNAPRPVDGTGGRGLASPPDALIAATAAVSDVALPATQTLLASSPSRARRLLEPSVPPLAKPEPPVAAAVPAVVEVRIGRIELRQAPTPAPHRATPRAPRPLTLGLAEYLNRRRGGPP